MRMIDTQNGVVPDHPAGLTRRGFLGASAFAFGIGIGGLIFTRSAVAESAASTPFNAWLSIAGDGTVTIVFPMTEMGQGSSTALPMILAEELDADWERVRVEQLDRDDRRYGNRLFGNLLYTAGSTSVMAYHTPLRLAGAQARRILIATAARHWSVPEDRLETEPGAVIDPDTARRLDYGALAELYDDAIPAPDISEADFKSRADYRLVGRDVPRRDVPEKSRGDAVYAIDVHVPDMLYAAVLRAPVEGETPLQIADADARSLAGVQAVLPLPDGVAVVADRLETAFAGRDALDVTWSNASPARQFDSAADLEAYAAAVADDDRAGVSWETIGDAEAAMAAAPRTVERSYRSDYAYHAQMEPMACVASVDPDGKGAEVWVGSQTQSLSTFTVVEVLETTPDRVRLHMMTMGGSFGRRTALRQEYVRDALLASRATGRPVKVVWTREDDVMHGWYRPAAAQRLRAGLTESGAIAGWHHRVATPSVIAHFNPLRWSQVEPKDIISMRGAENKHYRFADLLAEHVITERRARIIPWRAIGASYTAFAGEAFMDELATEAGLDPLDFRLKQLARNPRGAALLSRVAERSDYRAKRAAGAGIGLAFAGYGDTMAAGVAEITLDRDNGTIRVTRFTAAVDAGLVIAPDNALAQVEGGIVYGLSSALKERIDIVAGETVQRNYYDYEILRADEMPEIEVELIDIDAPPTGLGEAGTPMVPAAIANAFFALTGERLRHMPFTPDRVLAVLAG